MQRKYDELKLEVEGLETDLNALQVTIEARTREWGRAVGGGSDLEVTWTPYGDTSDNGDGTFRLSGNPGAINDFIRSDA